MSDSEQEQDGRVEDPESEREHSEAAERTKTEESPEGSEAAEETGDSGNGAGAPPEQPEAANDDSSDRETESVESTETDEDQPTNVTTPPEITRYDEHPEETLQRLREKSLDDARPERVRKQHDRGKKTARERLKYLLDSDSFDELDRYVQRRTYGLPEDQEDLPGDGVVCGFGEINGRRVACFSQDFTIHGGSVSEENGKKICKLMDRAGEYGLPLIGIHDSGGARIQEGVRSLASYGEMFQRNMKYSGQIPQISLIMGPCVGAGVYTPAMSDLVIMVEDSSFMYVNGPDVVQVETGKQYGHQDLGGAGLHRKKSGVCHLVGEDDQEALDLAVQALTYFPDNSEHLPNRQEPQPPDTSESIRKIIPEDKTRAYDVRRAITSFVDGLSFMELQKDFARNLITGFARFGGHVIGVVANQPSFAAGTLDIDASVKGARFVRLCDSFNIPILTLQDVPGFMPGLDEEAGGVVRHSAKLLYAYAEATVPLVTLITRKSFGEAHIAMGSKQLGADFNFAWPIAEIAVMGPENAVKVIHREEIFSADDTEEVLEKKRRQFQSYFGNPWEAARRGYIDDVIRPEETRDRLLNALEVALEKREYSGSETHGNMPL